MTADDRERRSLNAVVVLGVLALGGAMFGMSYIPASDLVTVLYVFGLILIGTGGIGAVVVLFGVIFDS